MDSSVEFDKCFWVFLNYFSYFSFYFASILGKWDIPGLISSVVMTTVPKAACSTQRGVHGHRTLLRALCAVRPAGVGVGDG